MFDIFEKNMSDKDKKRFFQCLNCKNLNTCDRDESDEDENGLCKFYDELPKPKQLYDFASILQKIIKRKEK